MSKILFVEDDTFIADIYKKKFEAAGFETVNVATGKDVLRAAKEPGFDLVLLDLVLPEMSGKEVLHELRAGAYDPKLNVVVFSNLSSSEDREECLKLGADGFISKTDFTPSEVVEEVRRFLRQSVERSRNLRRTEGPADPVNSDASPTDAGKRILLIEDEEVFTEMFGGRLRSEGYDVSTESDGASGLKAALGGGFDLVISDIMMPGVDGAEIVSRIRDAEAVKDTPVFLLSASVDDDRFREISESGTVEKIFLKTEMTPSELVSEVKRFFGTSEK